MSDDISSHVLRLQKAKADIAELELEKLRGSLIPIELVELFGGTVLAAANTKLLAIPSRLRIEFSNLSPTLLNRLDDLIREALDELGEDGLSPELSERLAAWDENRYSPPSENVGKKTPPPSYRHRPASW